jgi:hypothetical protein
MRRKSDFFGMLSIILQDLAQEIQQKPGKSLTFLFNLFYLKKDSTNSPIKFASVLIKMAMHLI